MCDLLHNPIRKFLDRLGADGTFLAGFLDSRKKLVAGKLFGATISLDDHQTVMLDLFVGSEPMAASEAFATPPDGESFP